ncbi:MAG: glycerol kinase GlpK [Alphaproteobacteria bacterium]
MPQPTVVLAIDQGTTSSRALTFGLSDRAAAAELSLLKIAQTELRQIYPRDGWVEQDAAEILRDTRAAISTVANDARIAAVGITNQRETTVLWDRRTGTPIHNAIVWQDRRGAAACRRLIEQGHDALIRRMTGLLPDSYFSATKIAWLLDHVDGARAAAARGDLAFGTIDTFLLWHLTGGKVHATDATNASRTMLFDIERQCWDASLLELFRVPPRLLPEVRDSAADYGALDSAGFGWSAPIRGIAGDQQAATVGQACFAPGMIKSTFGTGAFVVMNVGATRPDAAPGLLATVAYRIAGKTTYAVEGGVFNAGTVVKWLRDQLGLIGSAAETEALARVARPEHGAVHFVPAFTGLGAPYWDADARGAILGLTRATTKADIVRAALESVAFQIADLLQAFPQPAGAAPVLRVDGGMAANDWLMQRVADLAPVPVERPRILETTALGAASLACLGAGLVGSLEELAAGWKLERRFEPLQPRATRDADYAGWQRAVARVRSTPA